MVVGGSSAKEVIMGDVCLWAERSRGRLCAKGLQMTVGETMMLWVGMGGGR